jgi:hypothetical protein
MLSAPRGHHTEKGSQHEKSRSIRSAGGDRGRVCNGWTAVVGGTLLARNGPRRCHGCAGGRRLRLVMPAARFVYGRPVEEMGCAAARDHRGRQKCCTPYESQSIGFGRFGPHVLRHTMATQFEMSRIASGASFGKIRELLLPATSPFGLDQGRLVDASSHAS